MNASLPELPSDPEAAPAAEQAAPRARAQLGFGFKLGCCALTALGLALRVQNAWRDVDTLSVTTVPDDAYYYLSIARHVALGHPPSIDGLHPTNGYHPLWLMMLVAMFRFPMPDRYFPVHVAATLGGTLNVCAGLVLFSIARKLRFGPFTCGLILAAFMLNPYQVALGTCVLETPVALLFGLLLFRNFLAVTQEPVRQDGRSAYWFGALGGLAILARTDQALLMLVLLVFRHLRRQRMRPNASESWRWNARAVGSATAVVLPWLLYSLHTVGTIVQSSGLSLTLFIDRVPFMWGMTEISLKLRLLQFAAAIAFGTYRISEFLGAASQLTLPVLAAVLAIAYGYMTPSARAVMRARARDIAPLALSMLTLFLVHTLGRRVFREWYTAPFVTTLLLIVGGVFDAWLLSTRQDMARIGAIVALILFLGNASRVKLAEPLYGAASLSQIRENPSLHEGHSDCGAVAYYTNGKIVNLDGAVNQGAFEALQAGRLIDYIAPQGFKRVYIAEALQDKVFLGRHYRELIRADPLDQRAFRMVHDAAEKDQLIPLTDKAVSLGSTPGREYLCDGWRWFNEPLADHPAESLGPSSEIVFALGTIAPASATIEIELATIDVHSAELQPVEARFDGRPVAAFQVKPLAEFYSVPIGGAKRGRHRLTLVYGRAAARQVDDPNGWWFTFRGYMNIPVQAVIAFRMRLKLPPSSKS